MKKLMSWLRNLPSNNYLEVNDFGPLFFTCNVKNIRMEVNSFARNSSTWLSNVSSQTFNLIIFRWVTASIILRKRSSFRSNCWNWKLLIEIVRTKLRLRINMRTIVPVMENSKKKSNHNWCLIWIGDILKSSLMQWIFCLLLFD